MHKIITNICKSLDDLSSKVLAGTADDRTLTELIGWSGPALTRHDLAKLPLVLSNKIKKANIEELDDDEIENLSTIPSKIALFIQHTLPQMYNSNAPQALSAYYATLNNIELSLKPHYEWQAVKSTKLLPATMLRRLRSYKTQIDSIVVNKKELLSQIKLIQDATTAAESLPTDLVSLKEARKKIEDIVKESIKDTAKIENLTSEVVEKLIYITEKRDETDKLVDQCEEAYRITTTKGLSGAFEQRADKLTWSMRVWVAGLVSALGIGMFVGSERLKVLSSALASTDPNWGVIAMNIVLSLLSLAAPLWFAWLATKQISQRFRLSEDYAFKSTVAKAYEGYRKEAARLDSKFESRLFSTALERVEEAPLRLLEQETHGSPWHEMLSSDAFKDAMKTFPELRDKVFDLASEGVATAKKTVKSTKVDS